MRICQDCRDAPAHPGRLYCSSCMSRLHRAGLSPKSLEGLRGLLKMCVDDPVSCLSETAKERYLTKATKSGYTEDMPLTRRHLHPVTGHRVPIRLLGVVDRFDITWKVYEFVGTEEDILVLDFHGETVVVRDPVEVAYVRLAVREI